MTKSAYLAALASLSVCAPAFAYERLQLGFSYDDIRYGNARNLLDVLKSDAHRLKEPGAVTSIDSVESDKPDGALTVLLDYDLTRNLVVELNITPNNSNEDNSNFPYPSGGPARTLTVRGTGIQQGYAAGGFHGKVDVSRTDAYGLTLAGYWPLWHGLSVVARGGVERVRARVSNEMTFENHDCGESSREPCVDGYFGHHAERNVPVAGIGLAYRWPGRARVSVEYQRIASMGDIQTGHYSVRTLRFGFTLSNAPFRR